GGERIWERAEAGIGGGLVGDWFHSLSTGAPTAFPVAWRACLIWPRSTCGGSVRKLRGLSDILLAHHDDVGDANAVACIFAARAWLGEIDRAGKDGVAYLRRQRCPPSPQMHSAGTLKPMISKLRRYTASHRVPGNSNRASDHQLPVRMGVCGP